MDQKLEKTISNLKSWDDLAHFESNVYAKNRMTEEIKTAINVQAADLGNAFISEKTGLDLTELSAAEKEIVQVVSEYVSIMKRQGKYPGRTLEQLKNRGLLESAEISVCRNNPTLGFQNLIDAHHEELSYEKIVVNHPDEFSQRALWFSRKTLGLPNESDSPPASSNSDTQSRTVTLIEWLKTQANEHDGVMPNFTNADAAAVLGMADLSKYGRVFGNIQSRIDLACYQCGLPPLGLLADTPFSKAWAQGSRQWAFPVAEMQAAAKLRVWTADDFEQVLHKTEQLPALPNIAWNEVEANEEAKMKAWAFGLHSHPLEPSQENTNAAKRNPPWSRDELILALDLYLKQRTSPLGKDSPEVIELSEFLHKMGQALGLVEAETYRNANGVYMKLMNFRRFDPEYTNDGKIGLSRGNKDEEVVWNEFSSDPSRLSSVAGAIRSAIDEHSNDHVLESIDEPDIQEAEEGRVLTRLHRIRERSGKLVSAKKNEAFKQYGRLCCEACGFDFSRKYGPKGAGLIDVHHTKPVHTLSQGDVTRLEDLALLCANCHRVVHSSKKWLTVQQVRALVQDADKLKNIPLK